MSIPYPYGVDLCYLRYHRDLLRIQVFIITAGSIATGYLERSAYIALED